MKVVLDSAPGERSDEFSAPEEALPTKRGKAAARPAFSRAGVEEALARYDRTPFLDVLAMWLEAMPAAPVLKRFAEQSPGKYITAMASIARMAGFSEKTDITHTHRLDLTKMSDVELEQRLLAATASLGLPSPGEGEKKGAEAPSVAQAPSDAGAPVIDGDFTRREPPAHEAHRARPWERSPE